MNKSIVIGQTLGVVAAVFLGVGLFGYFSEEAAGMHPALGSDAVSGAMIAIGILLTILELGIMIPALKRRQAGKNQP